MTATRKWTALTVVVIAAVFAASWFFLISPKRSEATALRADTAKQNVENDRLRDRLEVLKAQALELPKQQAFLAQIRRQIPENPALPALIRDLTAAAKKSGVELTSLAPALPVAVVDTTVVAPVPTAATTGGTGAAAAPVAPPAPTLYQVPLVVKTTGGYFEMEQFLNKLEGLKRSFLVSGFTLRFDENAEEAAAANAGPLTLEITGRVFLSPAAAAVLDPTLPGTVPAPAATATPATATTVAPSTAPSAN
jgi:Tfp pilus assembly protein PilO